MEAANNRPAPAACLTVLTLLNPLNKPSIPVPKEGLDSFNRLPPSLRPLVLKVFQTYRKKTTAGSIPVTEFRSMYEKLTSVVPLVVRSVESAKKSVRPTVSIKPARLSGDNSPTRSLVTTASFGSPQVNRLSISTIATSVRKTSPKRVIRSKQTYTQQYHHRRNSEISQNQRDYETAQSMTRSLNHSLSLLITTQPSLEESRRDALLLVRKRHLEWSKRNK